MPFPTGAAPWGRLLKRKMGQKQDARTLYHINCACGAVVSMDARSFGRPTVCRKCGGSFTVGWSKDAGTGRAAPVAVSLARKRNTPLVLVCTCGYRRAVTAEEAAGFNRCPGCGRSMIVEKTPVARSAAPLPLAGRAITPPPLPAAPLAPPSEPRVIEIPEGAQAFSCLCGERLLIRSQMSGLVIDCPACDQKLRPIFKGTPRSSPKVPPPMGLLAGSRNPTPPPGTYTKPELTCECGQSLEIIKAFDANGTVCSACGRTITMEKVRAPQSKHTVIRPRFSQTTGQPAAPPAAPAAPADPAGIFELQQAEFQLEAPAPAAAAPAPTSAPPPPAPPSTHARPPVSSYQEVFCPCGEALTVSTEEVGRNMQCPTCLTLMAVDQLRDPRSGNYVIRVRAIGKMDQDTWSLSDFS